MGPFNDTFDEALGLEVLEAFVGGSWLSGNVVARGDCNLEDGTETTTSEETSVPVGLFGVCDVFEAALALELLRDTSPALSFPSFVPSMDAFIRLYNPLRPP